MNRRTAGLALLRGLLACSLAPLAARAQQAGKVYRIAYMSAPTRASVEQALQAFLRKLRELGWVEGRNLVIEYRWADGNIERLPDMAAELVREKVDLIVAPAASAALAAKNATSSIPIVMMFPNDPVGLGLVDSLRRPGRNITGTTMSTGSEIFAKQLQMLKEAVPRASRLAILSNPADASFGFQMKELEAASRALGVNLQHVQARGLEELKAAFASMARERAEGLVLGGSSTFLALRTPLAELAVKGRLPTMVHFREMVEAGSLMAYGVNMTDFIGRSAVYVDKILKGAKPGDLPVEQPTKFELVINLNTAKAIGLTIPQSVLSRADELLS
jgi:putative ABC transport system substrate-binding protein